MSKEGISTHFELTREPEEADYFYMGQFDDSVSREAPTFKDKFPFFDAFKERHICDIEGDWPGLYLPRWLEGSIITVNGLSRVDKNLPYKYLVRPTFSSLLVHLAHCDLKTPEPTEEYSFGFRGLPDYHGVRFKMKSSMELSECPHDIEFTNHWNGPTPIMSPVVSEYVKKIKRHAFGLCPRGNGKDSVRFFETCAYGRVPVVIGPNVLFAEDYSDTSFAEYVSEDMSISKMSNRFKEIFAWHFTNAGITAGQKSYKYFKDYVVDYFKDPTAYFIKHCLANKD